jgi:hypothetical protein
MSWSRRFFDPIELSDGRRLVTLKDAAEYITGLSASEHDLPHWRAAVAALISPRSMARAAPTRCLRE